jgi:hypothetical protein
VSECQRVFETREVLYAGGGDVIVVVMGNSTAIVPAEFVSVTTNTADDDVD